jgi:hypothetical protein
MDLVLDDLDPDLAGDFPSDLDLETGEFEKDFLLFSLPSLEGLELESLPEGLGLGLRFPLFPPLSFLFPFSLPLSRDFAMGDPSEGPWEGFLDFILSVLGLSARTWEDEALRWVLGERFWEWR